ncbi:prolyl oligopeptidase family serine peptidase, partial [Candidatus Gottesmanbacteria bacterium]|nr:prolyl oligopeptidase family serine peptidase [Candidatus Gottesmanbacteria bacterium]
QPSVDRDRIHVVGASYGGYMASLLSTKRPIASLVLRAPALYPDEKFRTPTLHIVGSDIQIYRQQHLTYQKNKALSAIHAYGGKILLIECENDDDVPKPTTNNFARVIRDQKQLTRIVIPGADHTLSQPQWKQFFIDTSASWFSKKDH